MEKTPDFVFTDTLGELLAKYTTYARYSTAAAYLCFMYADECGIPVDSIQDDEVTCDVLEKIIELCPDLFFEEFSGRTIDAGLTGRAKDDFEGRDISWYENMATLRKNLIKEMIRRYGEDFEFTVNVWVAEGE